MGNEGDRSEEEKNRRWMGRRREEYWEGRIGEEGRRGEGEYSIRYNKI